MKALSKNTRKILNGKTSAAQKVRAKGNAAKQIRNNVKMRQMFNQKLAKGPKGILKKPGAVMKVKKNVRFNLKPLGKGAKYGPKHLKSKYVKLPRTLKNAKKANALNKTRKTAKTARNIRKVQKTAKFARNANNIRKGVKAANTARKVGRAAMVGTGVGAVVVGAGLLAGAAGVDPVDMAVLKATNPAEYNRRMTALKKNPVKYMGNNLKNNTAKAARNVGNATKKAGQAVGKATKTTANKVGCGVGNIFKKKGSKKKC